ncbi:myosin light chain kinase, smooth muscle-like [Pomacea canaliculata]|uniref:myosin light chain kinase, smooth muscle-like n=1 Tax=Pomacea canaliculata TaxID=400727 RepID=UPI000D735A66|nr:myosin light chain kinase, smooth muscle-like [Pomacea canaliculata]
MTWYVNGIELRPTERTRIVKEGRTIVLIIINVAPQDSGEYTLKLENERGEVTCKTTLVIKGRQKVVELPDLEKTETLTFTRTVTTVQREEQVVTQLVKPVVVTPLEPEIYVRERGIARLECQIDSYPPPLVTWFVNGVEIKPSPHYEIIFEEGKSTLLIIEVGPEDTGEYTCRAVSELGEAISSTTLYVQEPLKEEMPTMPAQTLAVEPSPMMEGMVAPQFLEPLPTLQAIDGQEIKMSCRVAGVPMPRISFFHDSKNIDEDEEFVITYDKETGEISLIIVEVFPEDQGQYICVAENPAGQATTTAYLTIIESEETTMELEAQPQEITAYSWRRSCLYSSNPNSRRAHGNRRTEAC